MDSYFHDGELELQKKYNASHNPKMLARVLRYSIPDNYFDFLESQTTLIISSLDAEQNIWTSVIVGNPGFVLVKSATKVRIDLDQIKTTTTDILFANLKTKAQIGILIIDTVNQRRYRLNTDAEILGNFIELDIIQAFSNCPKYIQQRIPLVPKNKAFLNSTITKGTILNEQHKKWITMADTFFLGSMSIKGAMDASHRGGNPGFIEILEDNTLKIPDYVGNNLFNTFGNFLQNPKAGLSFIDFNGGNSLQITGKTTLLFDQYSEKDLETTTGTGRFWFFKPECWIETQNFTNVNWEFVSFSPFNP